MARPTINTVFAKSSVASVIWSKYSTAALSDEISCARLFSIHFETQTPIASQSQILLLLFPEAFHAMTAGKVPIRSNEVVARCWIRSGVGLGLAVQPARPKRNVAKRETNRGRVRNSKKGFIPAGANRCAVSCRAWTSTTQGDRLARVSQPHSSGW